MEGNKCIFENNYADDYGGATYIKTKSESTIKNTQFTNNQAKDNNGGAIYSNGDLRVSNCNFTKNKAKTDGGAIHINNKWLSVIENSKFIDNEAYNKGGAINIDDTSAHVVIKNNSFKGNTVDKDGEGSIIYNYGHFDKISNNYYGTNNPDWKNALYEHKYFGLDVEHRDSNHVRL